MLNITDQENLFKFIADKLTEDVECYAFGGTAMMYYGYKDETKDVDIIFETEKQRDTFINALKLLNFSNFDPVRIYIANKLKDKYKPLMFRRDTYRFDLFVKKIFKTLLSKRMKEDIFATHEYKGKKATFTVKVFRKEIIIMLKAVTDRKNDFIDIKTITTKEKHFNWDYFCDEVLWQADNGDTWILLDTEKMLQELKKYVFIEQKYFDKLYRKEKK